MKLYLDTTPFGVGILNNTWTGGNIIEKCKFCIDSKKAHTFYQHILYVLHDSGKLLGMVLSLLNFLVAMVLGYMLPVKKTSKDI